MKSRMFCFVAGLFGNIWGIISTILRPALAFVIKCLMKRRSDSVQSVRENLTSGCWTSEEMCATRLKFKKGKGVVEEFNRRLLVIVFTRLHKEMIVVIGKGGFVSASIQRHLSTPTSSACLWDVLSMKGYQPNPSTSREWSEYDVEVALGRSQAGLSLPPGERIGDAQSVKHWFWIGLMWDRRDPEKGFCKFAIDQAIFLWPTVSMPSPTREKFGIRRFERQEDRAEVSLGFALVLALRFLVVAS